MTERTLVLPPSGAHFHVLAAYDPQTNEALTVCGQLYEPQLIFDVNVQHTAICQRCAKSLKVTYGVKAFTNR